MGQHIRYPDPHARRMQSLAAPIVHKGEHTGIPFKCEPTSHHWRLNARAGDRCFCGERRWPDTEAS